MAAAPWLDEEEMRAWRTLVQVSVRLIERLDDELVAASGLSLADYEVLVHLSEAPGGQRRMSELADRTLMSRSRLTYRVNGLEAEGLVERRACPEDRRGWYAVLTATGRSRLEEAAPTHVAGVRRHMLDHISRPELTPLTSVLGRVAEALDDRSARREQVEI